MAADGSQTLSALLDEFQAELESSAVPSQRMLDWAKRLRAALAGARETPVGTFVYPHMCRDGHEAIGWRGDGEMCPVCREMAIADSERS